MKKISRVSALVLALVLAGSVFAAPASQPKKQSILKVIAHEICVVTKMTGCGGYTGGGSAFPAPVVKSFAPQAKQQRLK